MRARSLLLVMALVGCSYRPARFADRPAVTEVVDAPIPVPAATPFIEPVYWSDVYLRRPLVDALDAERFAYAEDVNAHDEVPRSSFWDPPPLDPDAFERAYRAVGPPEPPLDVDETRLVDRRGRRYELIRDPPGFPATRSAAAVIASRLVRAMGYRTPEVWRIDRRHAAMRWPLGVDLGATAMSGTRGDDPNDRIEHGNRRTLRALGLLAAWLEIRDLGPRRLVDIYVGAAHAGHVQHYVIGLDEALGAGSLGPGREQETAAGVVRGSAFENLITLGLARPDPGGRADAVDLRVFPARVARDYELRRPWEPVDRLLPSDGYWLVKRIAALPTTLIERAVDAAALDPKIAEHVVHALEARRTALIARWLRVVTPLELVELDGAELSLSDEAIRLGYASATLTRYHIDFLQGDGTRLGARSVQRASNADLEISIPSQVARQRYFVVRIFAERNGAVLPRAFEAHVSTRGSAHVIGIRH